MKKNTKNKVAKHICKFRVYYEDTDAGGVMYHASYIRFCERGRAEFLTDMINTSCSELEKTHNILFVIKHLEADYRYPAYLDDILQVQTSVISVKNSSFIMEQQIFLEQKLLFSMEITLVCVGSRGKPVRIPEKIRSDLERCVEVK